MERRSFKKIIAYLYGPNDLPYHILSIECDQLGSNIEDEILIRLGFIPTNVGNLHNIYTSANPNFQLMLNELNEENAIIALTKWYCKFMKKKKRYYLQLLQDLNRAYEVMNGKILDENLRKAKMIEIQFKSEVLGIPIDNQFPNQYLGYVRKLEATFNLQEEN